MKTKVYGKRGKGLLGTRSTVFEQDSLETDLRRGVGDMKLSRPVLKERTGNSNGGKGRKNNAYDSGQGTEGCTLADRVHIPQDIAKSKDPAMIEKFRKRTEPKAVERMVASVAVGSATKDNTALPCVPVHIPREHDMETLEITQPPNQSLRTARLRPKQPTKGVKTTAQLKNSLLNIDEVTTLLQDRLVVTETPECHRKNTLPSTHSPQQAAPKFIQQLAHIDADTFSYVSPLLGCKNVSGNIENFQAWTEERMSLLEMQKVGEGSFGEVYRATSNGETVIMKIIPLNARKGRGSRTFTSIEAAANEVQLLEKMQKIPGFVEFRGACILQGAMPSQLIQEWNYYKAQGRTVGSRDPNKTNTYLKTQLWLLIEMSDAGTNLNPGQYHPDHAACYTPGDRYLSVQRSWDIFWQIVRAIAKAEIYAEFEHRDLHLGNICARNTRAISDEEDLTLVPSDEATPFSLDNTGVQVTIIDYSLARAIADGDRILSYDFKRNDGILKGEGELQYDIYRYMAKAVGRKSCKAFVPKTNVLWLSYLVVKLLDVTIELSDEAKFEENGCVTGTAKMKTILEEVRDVITLGMKGEWVVDSAGGLLELGTTKEWFSLHDIIGG